VALSDVFASNLLVRWLRGDPSRYDLITTMVGVRLGDRLVCCGAGDPALTAALAKVTGLSGRAVAHAATKDEAAVLAAGAERAGVLLEVVEGPAGALPLADGEFDLAVIDAASALVDRLLPECRRVLRSGGRVVSVVRVKAPGAPSADEVLRATSQHFRGARILLDRDGYALVEALKGQPPAAAS